MRSARNHYLRVLSVLVLAAASAIGGAFAEDAPRSEQASPADSTDATGERVTAEDGHVLTLWSKSGEAPKRAILLLHGRTWSALPNFDLQVPGAERSVLDALVARGYAAYALDQRGYGSTVRDATGWLSPRRAADDVIATLRHIQARHPELPAPAVVGYSQGAMTALLAAQSHPEEFSALVLYGFPADVDAAPTGATEPETPPQVPTTAAAAAADFVVAGAASQAVIAAYVGQALGADPVRVDWRDLEQFRFEPERVLTPTLLLQGVADGYIKPDALARLFTRLGCADRSWVVLPDSDHAAHVESAQPAWISAIVDFIERPRPGLEPQ
jgi:pimeloyl-ACP methyl ester carboxylesterase